MGLLRALSCLTLLQQFARIRDARAMVARPDLSKWIPSMRPHAMHSGDLKELIDTYRVVVLMTTIPDRIDFTEPVIDSMLQQSWPATEIYISIPDVYNRTGEMYDIPDWLLQKAGIQLVRCEDLGPGTHLLNGLRLEQDPWTFLVVVDDDHIYGSQLVEQLMRAAIANPGTAIAAQGFLSVPGLLTSSEIVSLQEQGGQRPRYLQDQGFAAGPVLVSYLGVVYQRGFFDDTVYSYSDNCKQCRYQDDMWFSAHLARKGIRRLVLGSALGVQELTEMHLGPESLTKWVENRPRQISDDCNKGLLSDNSQLWAFRRRVVLGLGGLPPGRWPIPEQVPKDWLPVLSAISRLPRMPDLTYLCSSDWDKDGLSPRSFMFGGVLVTGSNACATRAEAGVSQLMRDAMLWEGDPNTVLVMGLVPDLESDPSSAWAAAACAAGMYDATVKDAEQEETRLSELKRRVAAAKDPEAARQSFMKSYGHMLLHSLFRRHDMYFGIGDAAPRDPTKQIEKVWPYCRVGSWVAATVGAFSAAG
mmetsp:Transcript_26551/g.61796  ORF Transcript_26551/g.61796 Transcript_26551/m.61796 type:complete len:529 (-) Transcript_26551:45-1631(-)